MLFVPPSCTYAGEKNGHGCIIPLHHDIVQDVMGPFPYSRILLAGLTLPLDDPS